VVERNCPLSFIGGGPWQCEGDKCQCWLDPHRQTTPEAECALVWLAKDIHEIAVALQRIAESMRR